ncbi:MAG: phosphatase PAP2 family protein [Thermomicrobiales bacterium]
MAGAAIVAFDAVSAAPAAAAHFAGSPALEWAAAATPAAAAGDMLATWPLWILPSASELRPAAPSAPTEQEIAAVVAAQTNVGDAAKTSIAKWGRGPAVIPWPATMQDLFVELGVGGFRGAHDNALVHAAMHDAAIAAWDAQVAYARPGLSAASDKVTPASGVDPKQSSYPSEHATVAAAAATMMAHLFPTATAGRFDALAMDAATSRLAAGAAFQSDIDAGLALGKAVADKAIARAKTDGSDAKFDPKDIPSGPERWKPAPPKLAPVPVEPLGGSWKAWLLERNDEFRPGPPPVYGSARFKAEVGQVRETVANRTLAEEAESAYNQRTALLPPLAFELIRMHALDLPHAARVLAYLNVAAADSAIAVWDAKYTW